MKIIFLGVAIVLVSVVSIYADSIAPPCSYITYSSDRAFAFVMLAPRSEYECGSASDDTVGIGLRKRFRSSGMYEKGDPTRLKWAVGDDWFAYKVFITNDGESLVRMGPWARSMSDEAFSFFRNGSVVRTVAINELIKNESSVERSVSHFMWSKGYGLTSDGSRFFINTLEGAGYQFDVKTGEMTSSTPPTTTGSTSPAGERPKGNCTLALFFLAAFAAFRRKLASRLLP